MSYQDLRRQIETAGRTLMAIGIQPGDRLALVLPNGPEMATAVLALASFGVCAPLNPQYEAEEYEFYLSDLRVRALVIHHESDSPAREVARRQGIEIIELEYQEKMAAGSFQLCFSGTAPENEWIPACAEDAALLLHTSGTTSRPKVVSLTHHNLCASAFNVANSLQLSAGDRCLSVMPLFHIHGIVAALLSSLVAGQSIACTPGFDPGRFFDWVDDLGPTWYTAVPTIHRAVLASARAQSRKVDGCFRLIRSSSSALPPRLMAELEETFRCPVIEAYGMTEAAHQITSNPLPPDTRKPGSVGVPAGPKLAIMDQSGRVLGSGESGEIVIQGPNVTAGYENRPQANQEAFSDGWFRTGDQGLIDTEGYLVINGRLKEIINRGGETVSPVEIDEALLKHPGVDEAVAFAVPHPTLGEDIAAAVVTVSGSDLSEQAIREFAFERLADFKVPSRVVIVDEIPKTSTGKVQRLNLPVQLEAELHSSYVAPRCDVEFVIAELWAERLELDQVGIEENFFALGGDSISGTQIIARMHDIFGVMLPVPELFARPTVAELAELIGASAERSRLDQISAVASDMRANMADPDVPHHSRKREA